MRGVAAIILAAGRATRFEAGPQETKAVAPLEGKPLIRHVAEAALASHAKPVYIVTGHARDRVEAALEGLPVHFIHNADFASGLAGSLKAGLAAVPEHIAGVLVLLADMPRVSPGLIDRLVHAYEVAAGEPCAILPLYRGQRGNPVLLSRRLFPEIMKLEADRGARAIIDNLQSGVIECPVDDEAVAIDIDTQAALRELELRGLN